MWPDGNLYGFKKATDSPLAQPNGRLMPAVRAAQWDCEIVYNNQGRYRASCPPSINITYVTYHVQADLCDLKIPVI